MLREHARSGCIKALDIVVRRYIDFVYATARREMAGDAHAADDVT